MSLAPSLDRAAAAAQAFLAAVPVGAGRLEADVAGADGMPLLCAVESVLAGALPQGTSLQLVWLTHAAGVRGHRLRLRAFAPDNRLLDEATHELAP